MLRKKLPIRPVIRTAKGGSTTQKKYRNAFISFSFRSVASRFGRWFSITHNLQSLDWKEGRDRARVSAFQNRHPWPRRRSPYIYRSERRVLPAFRDGALHRAPHFLEDRALLPSV